MSEGFFEFRERITKRVDASMPAPSPARVGGDKPLTVSQLTRQIDRALRENLPAIVYVRGEVSNFNEHRASGHMYFTLKDDSACIDCVMFKSDAAAVKFEPRDGMELLATGAVKVYAQRGRYQLYVSRLEPIGQGALELAFQQLRSKLEGEGLFAEERKKPLPAYPQRIVLVTAAQAAALQDMLKVLRRFAWVKVFVYAVPVQGDGAAARIAAALKHVSRRADDIGGIDLIILGRGGGSLEDLWAFNEEAVARAIATSRIPIITGVGHEVDVSIADLVADYHAHTPTEAAQVATANWRGIEEFVDDLRTRMRRRIGDRLVDARQRLDHVSRHEFFRRPTDRVNTLRQFLDDRQRQLHVAITRRVWTLRRELSEIEESLAAHSPAVRVGRLKEQLQAAQQRLRFAATVQRERRRSRVDALERELRAVSPEAVLRRGFSMTTLKSGDVVRSVGQVKGRETIVTRVADGTFESIAEDPRQPKLFD
ncbi:MAG: exodeoxyribonuclease VII large subunit [Tepidisphaeraceae bacterium]